MLELRDVGVSGHHGPLLSEVNVQVENEGLFRTSAPTRMGRTALALLAAGRMAPDSGQVLFEEREDTGALRRASALVDSPGLTAPEHHMRTKDLVAETLGLQPRVKGRPRKKPDQWLRDCDAEDLTAEHVETLPADIRLWLLLELAFSDPGVGLAVLDSPGRHDISAAALDDVLTQAAGAGRSILAVSKEYGP